MKLLFGGDMDMLMDMLMDNTTSATDMSTNRHLLQQVSQHMHIFPYCEVKTSKYIYRERGSRGHCTHLIQLYHVFIG